MINTPTHRIALSALCLTAMIGSIAVTGPAAGATPVSYTHLTLPTNREV